ncbi:MAG TPA: PRC-barrel domain-containing protein [Usitatibacter sp.]|nr:PRC-barrel domain-containing protein [Usitatibacter sp.]
MLRNIQEMESFAIRATDGTVGHVVDFLFDDEKWAIRYLVVDTGSWLPGRKVLISPIAVGRPEWAEKVLPVLVTREQVKASPGIDTEKPVSRQHEMSYMAFYGYQEYWSGNALWGAVPYPSMMTPLAARPLYGPADAGPNAPASVRRDAAARAEDSDPHLRSCKVVTTYAIEANDGDIGHVQGLLVDEETWAIRYMVVNTSNWWLGHQVLIAPQWIQDVRWSDATVSVDLSRQAVKDAPTYDPGAQLDRDQELAIDEHYGPAPHGPARQRLNPATTPSRSASQPHHGESTSS